MVEQSVVLIHGIWMNGMEMSLLRWRLRRAGYRVYRFQYASVSGDWQDNVAALADYIRQLEGRCVHVVAHSLGGLLLRDYLAGAADPRIDRLVTLGCPHQGSALARLMLRRRLGRLLLGGARRGLCEEMRPWSASHPLGILAGDLSIGVGCLLTRLERPNDGTVVLAENWLERASDRRVIHASHFGLLFSREVAAQTIHFLRRGRFAF